MSNDSPDIVDAALNLSDPERANLAYRLLQSLQPPEVICEGEAKFEEELERSVKDYESGQTSASDWDDVAARLRMELRERKPS